MAIEAGTVLGGKFRVIRLLGAGGMGAVYEIEHLFTKHRRALKLLHREVEQHPHVIERFLREASAAGRIGNPHIVETFDAGSLESGEPYLVMELLEGCDLATRIAKPGGIGISELVRLVRQAANGVQAAHDAGIIHRDLKPENLFITQRDGQPFVKVLDFGISKFDTGGGEFSTTKEGSMLGTPYYMAPEQLRGAKDLDARADVYALGVILYQASAGRRPFEAATLPALALVITEGRATPLHELRPDLPRAFCELVQKAMQPDRALRLESARDLSEALEPFEIETVVDSARTIAAPAASSIPVTRQSRTISEPSSVVASTELTTTRRPGAPRYILALAGVALVAIAAAVFGARGHSERAPAGSASAEPVETPQPSSTPTVAAIASSPASIQVEPVAPDASVPRMVPSHRPVPQSAGSSKAERSGLEQHNPY